MVDGLEAKELVCPILWDETNMHGPWIVQDRSTHGCHRDPLATMLPISYCQPADLARKELYGLISSEVVAEHGKDFAITMNGPLLAANPAGLQWDPAMT